MGEIKISFCSETIEQNIECLKELAETFLDGKERWKSLKYLLEEEEIGEMDWNLTDILNEYTEVYRGLRSLAEKLKQISDVYINRELEARRIVEDLSDWCTDAENISNQPVTSSPILHRWNGKLEPTMIQSSQLFMEGWLSGFLYQWLNQWE